MFTMRVTESFDAAHRVVGYPGKCDNLHGHTWKVELQVSGSALDSLGMLVDFKLLRGALKEVLETFDHQNLNTLPPFATKNPTAEHLAKYLYDTMAAHNLIRSSAVTVESVCVWESEHSAVVYSEKP